MDSIPSSDIDANSSQATSQLLDRDSPDGTTTATITKQDLVNEETTGLSDDLPSPARDDVLKPMEIDASLPQLKMTRFQVIKNILVLSIAFLFLFSAFLSLSNLQSSLHRQEGFGTVGLAVINGAYIISCIFLPPFVINHLGCKWTLAFSMLCYIAYLVANFYAVWGTIIPSAVLLGLGAAPLWTAKCTYLTKAGEWYAKMTGANRDDVINRFFGVFFMVFQTGQVWGNLVSSLVFSSKDSGNDTALVTEEQLATCGANDKPLEKTNNTNFQTPDIDKVYVVCGVYVGLAVVAFVIVVAFLDRLEPERDDVARGGQPRSGVTLHLLVDTFRQWWRCLFHKLLVPLTLYVGIEQPFIAGDFTRSYVNCGLGIENVGFVMICYGAVSAVSSYAFGRLVECVGRVPLFLSGAVAHLICQVTLLVWVPNPNQIAVFYILAALWGAGEGIFKTHVSALYGYLFSEHPEAAFSNCKMWEALGSVAAWLLSGYVLTRYKLYICIVTLTVATTLYCLVELLHRRETRRDNRREICMDNNRYENRKSSDSQ